jgi:hypothetical protein
MVSETVEIDEAVIYSAKSGGGRTKMAGLMFYTFTDGTFKKIFVFAEDPNRDAAFHKYDSPRGLIVKLLNWLVDQRVEEAHIPQGGTLLIADITEFFASGIPIAGYGWPKRLFLPRSKWEEVERDYEEPWITNKVVI